MVCVEQRPESVVLLNKYSLGDLSTAVPDRTHFQIQFNDLSWKT